MKKVEIDVNEVKEVFILLEKLQEFMHQPKHYKELEQVYAFVSAVYPEVREAYYQKVWNWLPEDVQKEMEER